ncbi:unnamed protein product [Parnassius apollo]|uniref:(apollo) hypothetical protein n=1 Tax=Parnassius apollo TaxID=110799 RepID=A0A8S3WED2_PARAO|nr:unnamed protein product [Parnassius apollo]
MENNIVSNNEERDFCEFQMDLADFELSQEDLQEIETLEFNALQTSFRDISSDDESENLHVPKKRRRMVINSDSESDSVKDFVLQSLPTSSNTYTKWKNPTGCTARVIPFTEPTAYYAPKEELCVDESMIPFRGRVTFRQYNKSKRHKYGIKLFKVCTNPGYTLKIQVYSGKNIDIENNTPTKIVLSLCDELLNKGHTIATDNWYTSLELAYELLKNDTHFLGTVRKNRKYLPMKVVETNLKRGEFVAQENDFGITVLKWKDKRDVLMLSTKHMDKFTRLNVRGKAVQKPAMVIDYNKCKASVDMSDQMTAYSTPLRKTVKWYRKLAIELLLNTAVVNALIMYKETTKKNISVVDYRKKSRSISH